MASSGEDAWKKHFQGKGDIETKIKKDTKLYDIHNENTAIGEIKAGTSVTYIKSNAYEKRAAIKFKQGSKTVIARVTFNDIAKPNVKSSGAASLKPQAFNVKDKQYTIKEYRDCVLSAIDERKDLNPSVKVYLYALFDYYSGGKTTKSEISKIFLKVKGDLPINDINKDFGEVVGPVAVCKLQLFKDKKINFPSSTKIFVPSRPNEPLMDYALIAENVEYTISAKSGTTTNTVKPKDIIALLSKRKDLNALKTTKEYKLLEGLAGSSVLMGPIRAVSSLYPELISEDALSKIDEKSKKYNLPSLAKLFQKSEYLKQKKDPTLNEIMYECEKMIVKETKDGDINLNDIFSKAIEKKVWYVKFEVGTDGSGDWDVVASDDIKAIKQYGRISLRSKNGYTRASDALGVQV